MGMLHSLAQLRDFYLAGKLTDEEYDAAQVALFKGEPIESILKAANSKSFEPRRSS